MRGRHLRLDGAKAWITNAGVARWYVVMAMTEPSAGTRGITAFLVSGRTTRACASAATKTKMGLHGVPDRAGLSSKHVEIPESRRLGDEGQGFRIAMTTLDHSRIGIAAQALGIARAAFEAACDYARTRETFGKKLFEHEAIAFQIADMKRADRGGAAADVPGGAGSEIPGSRFSKESSMAKVYASEAANAIGARAVQIFGGYGYSKEYAVERYYRDARVTTIYEGTSEIQRIVISKNVLAGR